MTGQESEGARTITEKSRRNIKEKLERFWFAYPGVASQIAITFPANELQGIDGQRVKDVARSIQRVLSKEFGAKGYRVIEFSKHKKTGLCDIPHFHILIDREIDSSQFVELMSAELDWSIADIHVAQLVSIGKAHAGTARYFAKTDVPKVERCDLILQRFSAIKRVFAGFGWGKEPRPGPRKGVPFGPGLRGFKRTKDAN
jgi:hypothetical protein